MLALVAAPATARADPTVFQADPPAADCTGASTAPDCQPATTATGSASSSGATSDRNQRNASRPDSSSAGPAAPSAPSTPDPTTGSADQQPAPATTGDPFTDLGGRSPSCQHGAAGQSATNCRATGSPAHRYPIGNYTYDIKIDTGLTHFSDNLLAALQTMASFLWLGFLYAIKGVLLALDWAFHLNLIDTNIDKVHGGLLTMDRIFGLDSGYFSLALTLAALWGMWHGFVRGKYIETVAGLAACVGLMLIALLIVHDPAGTVGTAGSWGDTAGRQVASQVAGAVRPGDPAQADEDGLDRGAQAIFDTVVLRPWCALEFGDVDFCLSKPPTDAKYFDGAGEFRDNAVAAPTVADLWLAFPANGKERNKLYEAWKDDGDTLTRPRVEMMQGQSTGKRLALLAIIIAGLLGALLLLGWISFWLIAFAALALFYLLLAPFVFLMPALGEAGRRGFIGWGKRLLGALIAKLLYAIILGIVIYVAALIAEMGNPGGLGWLGVWVIEAIFWWMAFLKRHELVSLLTFNAAQGGDSSTRRDGLSGTYYKTRLAQEAARTVQQPVSRHIRRQIAREGMTEAMATGSSARERLAHHAERSMDVEYENAVHRVRERRELQNELKGVDSALRPADEARALQRAGAPHLSPLATEEEDRLRERRHVLQERVNSSEMRQAEATVRRAADNQAKHGRRWTDEDRERWIERRRRELARPTPARDDPEHERWVEQRLLGAGISPERFREAGADEQQDLLGQARQATAVQRDLLRGVPDDGEVDRPGYRDLRAVRRQLHDREWRIARTQARRAMHREAWRRRARENVFRARR